ncbi:MAG: 16S rRNA (adenine(1518)-N(6)/adenine(1519)-N(6))-dimethyltransferase RsmA [Rickettsiales bacterium]|jgi:16S rRNA (adenine1518-N6/adenine1519-N6)-dimethyltransferase|nr:16S rRNA (adenine(1518)-N(6)/adenine(1519)-N(6))-dimethyltransferase RsmA [Rickettsiales bacterium]
MLTTKQIIKKHNLVASKSLGQNFLLNPVLLDKIVAQCDFVENENILEIGTGPGGLTHSILKKNPKKLVTVDIDKKCIEAVKAEFSANMNLYPVLANAVEIDERNLFENEPFSIISNLPYNIGTVLLFKWIKNCLPQLKQMVFLLQKEVVERIIAKSGTRDYGKVSVLCQYIGSTRKCFDIQNTAFFPPPKITSSVVKLTVKHNQDFSIIEHLSSIVVTSFSQRRKTLFNNLKTLDIETSKIFEKLGFHQNIRPENLSVDDFVALTKEIIKYTIIK